MHRKTWMTIGIVAVVFIGLFASDGIAQELFVQSAVAPLWTAPNGHASPVGVLSQGMKVQQLKEQAHWCYVRYENQLGWILKMRLGVVDPRDGVAVEVQHSVVEASSKKRHAISNNSAGKPAQQLVQTDTNNHIWHLFKAFSW